MQLINGNGVVSVLCFISPILILHGHLNVRPLGISTPNPNHKPPTQHYKNLKLAVEP